MDDAWQQDIAPSNSGVSIPTQDNQTSGTAMNTDEPSWNANGGGRSSGRDGGERRRRSSRSRSPGARGDRGDRGDRGGGRGGDRNDDGGTNPGNNLHVAGLSHKVDSTDLEAAFSKIGRVQKASVMRDPHTRESRGFGFVTMETGEEADAAVTALNGTDLLGKTLNIEKARRGSARTPTPGRYYGPPKRNDFERPYDPRPYDSRYSRDYDDRRGGGGRGERRYDDRGGGGGRDYDRGGDRGGRDYDRGDRGGDRGGDRAYGGGGGGGGGRREYREDRGDRGERGGSRAA